MIKANKITIKILSFILAFILILSSIPLTIFAKGASGDGTRESSTGNSTTVSHQNVSYTKYAGYLLTFVGVETKEEGIVTNEDLISTGIATRNKSDLLGSLMYMTESHGKLMPVSKFERSQLKNAKLKSLSMYDKTVANIIQTNNIFPLNLRVDGEVERALKYYIGVTTHRDENG